MFVLPYLYFGVDYAQSKINTKDVADKTSSPFLTISFAFSLFFVLILFRFFQSAICYLDFFFIAHVKNTIINIGQRPMHSFQTQKRGLRQFDGF